MCLYLTNIVRRLRSHLLSIFTTFGPGQSATRSGSFIVNPLYDLIFFIGAPLIALAIGGFIYYDWLPNPHVQIGQTVGPLWEILVLVIFTQSHLFIVFFRSYLNEKIYTRYKKRLIYMPIIILTGCLVSKWFLTTLIVINVWWDAWHSSLQTFGFARMYDARVGNDARVGRRLDYCLSLVIYLGPIIAGVVLLDHMAVFSHYSALDALFLSGIPVVVAKNKPYITLAMTGISAVVIAVYCVAYWRLYQKGYAVSWQKIALFVFTAITTTFAWGFNSFGVGFVIANFFHAWQYFALVYWSEKKSISQWFRLKKLPYDKALSLIILLVIGLGFGILVATNISPTNAGRFGVSVLATIGTLHFYYDGFIWSVRKKEV